MIFRFERNQYLEVCESMTANKAEWSGKTISDIYGAEHLSRLLGICPAL